MAIKFVDEADLTTVCNAIRAKTGGSDLLTFPAGMAAAIAGIEAGGEGIDFLICSQIVSGTYTPVNDIRSVAGRELGLTGSAADNIRFFAFSISDLNGLTLKTNSVVTTSLVKTNALEISGIPGLVVYKTSNSYNNAANAIVGGAGSIVNFQGYGNAVLQAGVTYAYIIGGLS